MNIFSFPPGFEQGYPGDPGLPGPVHFQDGHDARGKNTLKTCSFFLTLCLYIYFTRRKDLLHLTISISSTFLI